MSDGWADAMVALEDQVSSAVARANRAGVTDAEAADELERIAKELRTGLHVERTPPAKSRRKSK